MRTYRLIANLCAAILLLVVSLGILGVSQMLALSNTSSEYSRILREEVVRLQSLRTLTAGFFQVNRLCLNSLIQSDPKSADAGAVGAAQLLGALSPHMELLANSGVAEGVAFQELKSSAQRYALDVAAFYKLLEEGRESDAREYRLQHLRPQIEKINELLGEIAGDMNSSITLQIQGMSDASEKRGATGLIFSLWPFVVIIVSLVWAGIVTLRYLASADLSSEIPVR